MMRALALFVVAAAAAQDTCSKCPDPTPVGTICCKSGQNCPNGDSCCDCGGADCLCSGSGPEPPPAPTPPPGPPSAQCSKTCYNTVDCADNQHCKFCLNMSGTGANRTGRCGAHCGEPCETTSDCWFQDSCQFCYGGVCSQTNPVAKCHSPCVSDITCRNAPLNQTSDCRLCYGPVGSTCQDPQGNPTGQCTCGAGCGRRCSDDNECVAPTCPKCVDFGGSQGTRCNATVGGQ